MKLLSVLIVCLFFIGCGPAQEVVAPIGGGGVNSGSGGPVNPQSPQAKNLIKEWCADNPVKRFRKVINFYSSGDLQVEIFKLITSRRAETKPYLFIQGTYSYDGIYIRTNTEKGSSGSIEVKSIRNNSLKLAGPDRIGSEDGKWTVSDKGQFETIEYRPCLN